MVFDNADGGYEIIEKFLPPGVHGNILITSRNDELIRVIREENSMRVQEMDEEEAISLLLKSLSIKQGSGQLMATARMIVSQLGYIPLAIDQAGAYIHRIGCGLDRYLDIYHKQLESKELMSNLSFKGASNYGKSTYGTWEVSMKEIESRASRHSGSETESLAAQSAVTLLKYFAFLHYDNISENIFRNAAENYRRRDFEQERSSGMPLLADLLDHKALFLNEAGQWDNLQFQAGIQVLLSFSLIKRSGDVYSIHPLMHAWSRDRIPKDNASAAYHLTAALLSCAIEPDRYLDNYTFCMQIIPHLRASHAHALKSQIKIMSFYDECQRFAFAFDRAGNWTESQQLYMCMIRAQTIKLGTDNPHTLQSMHHLAKTYRHQGRLEDAERLTLQVLDGYKSSLESDTPETLTIMHGLAAIYGIQGRVEEAEGVLLKVLKGRKAKLGADHLDTLLTMHSLASAYLDKNRLIEAETLQLQVLDGRKAKLGPGHPETLAVMHDLALTYGRQGRVAETEELQLQVLDGKRTKLGPDHPETLSIMHDLAITYGMQRRVRDEEKLLLKVLDRKKAILGADHPDTLLTMHCLGLTYVDQRKLKEAEQLLSKVLEGRKAKLGANHPGTLLTMHCLALAHVDQGKLKEAEKLLLMVLDGRKAKLGADHPDTVLSMSCLALVYRDQGRLKETRDLELQILNKRK